MGRHHCILRVTPKKDGSFLYSIADDDSLVGTFVGGRLLDKKEWCRLNDGDVITMGATSAILYTSDHKDTESEEKN